MKQNVIRYGSLSYVQTANEIRVGDKLYPRIWQREYEAQIRLYKEINKDLGKLFKWLKKQYRKEFIFGSVLLLALLPAPTKVKALSVAQSQPLYIHHIAPIAPIQGASFTVPKQLALVVPPPPPAPVYAPSVAPTGGCVMGYSTGDFYLDKIITFESSGNSCATNPGGCFGLLQACPGAPLKAACGGNPTCQIGWFQANKTGGRSWAQVWAHELSFGWW